MKIGLVWFVSLLVTSPLIVIGFIRPDEIMSQDDLQCSITNRPFLIYGSLTAYFFPLGVMLVAYSASIRLLGQQGADSRLRLGAAAGNGNEDPGNGLRRSRSGRHHTRVTHSGARTPEVYVYRFRRDECAPDSAPGSVRSFRDRDAAVSDIGQQRSPHNRSLSPLLSGDDVDGPSISLTPSSTLVRTGCRTMGVDRPLTNSGGTERTCRNVDELGTLLSQQHSCGGVKQDVQTVNQKSRDDVSCDVSRDMPTASSSNANVVASSSDGSFRSVAHASGRRFRSLVQKHAATIRASGELSSHLDDVRQERGQVATAVAAAAAIRTVRTERKAARVIGAVFAVFVTCWTPFFVLNLSLGICGLTCQQAVIGADGLYPVFLWLGYVASTLNPIVYTVFNGTFRRTFADLLTCRRSCARRPPNMAPRIGRRRQDSCV